MEEYSGLTSQQALENQRKFGLNQLAKKTKKGIILRFLGKLFNPMVAILIFTALLSFILGQTHDFFVILTIIVLSLSLDVYQEHTAENAAEKLQQKIALTTEVLRDGTRQTIPNSLVTVDDIIFLDTGDIVPADAKLLEVNNLLVDQSSLTGESYPQLKETEGPNSDLFMGTVVVCGNAVARITQIGKSTQFGKISNELISKKPTTEFETGVNNFAFLLVKSTAIFSTLILIISILILRHDLFGTLLFVLALAIGFAPELLPMILTINLSRGALLLSKKKIIVKFLPSIENFGSMDVLCTDKTGTLTENKTTLEAYQNINSETKEEILLYSYLNSCFQTGFKNPIDEAILAYRKVDINGFEKIGEIPFDFYRKKQSVIVKQKDKIYLISKGNPENILAVSDCSSPNEEGKFQKYLADFAEKGMRVIAVAIKEIDQPKKRFTVEDEKNLKLIGLLAFMDPPKRGAAEALKSLRNSGVITKILTGDSELVTEHIWRQLNLPEANTILGTDLENLDDEQFSKAVEEADIFAQLNPDMKEKIVLTLKKNGHVVGFLGDGINDAPSLKTADIGISVNNGVDIAKETADLILLNKDLAVLHDGIIEGRKTFANIMKYLVMGTSSTFGNAIGLSLASLLLPFLPVLPIQVLLNDLMYDVSQILLVNDNVDRELLERPRKWQVRFIRDYMITFGVVSSIFDFITFALLITFFRANPSLFRTGWFLETIITQVLIIFSIRTAKVPFYKSKISRSFGLSLIAITFLAILIPYTFIGPKFHFVRLPMLFYLILAGVMLSYFLTTEGVKVWFYRKHQTIVEN